MAENEVQTGTSTDKHDDFFDEPPKHNTILTPEPPKENGEVESEAPKQNGDVTPTPQETTDSANGEGDKGGDDAAVVVNGGQEESQTKDDDQHEDAADGDAGAHEEEEAKSRETPALEATEAVPPDGVQQSNEEAAEQDGMTSDAPTPTVETTQEQDGNTVDDENDNDKKPTQEEQESESTTEPKTEEPPQTPEVAVQQTEEEVPQQSPTEQEERRTPSGGEDNYDDSFSDDTSLKNATEGEALAPASTETKEDGALTPVANDEEKEQEGATNEPGTDPQQRVVSPSPSDSRAEAGAVVPVVSVTDDTKAINDGRSSVTADDQGELFRGEDRKEEPAPEGSEDCRGQGQWNSAEQQYIASAILVEKNDKEALDEAVKDKERLHEEYSEAKVKDLQERLAILARENEQKDKRISKLEQNLVDVTDKLRETERKLFATEKLNQQHQEAPKSKTCTIM